MAWTALHEPSLGLAVLKSSLREAGWAARVRHLNLAMLRYVQPTTYHTLGDAYALNDFLFTGLLDPGLTTRQWGWLRAKSSELAAGGRIPGPADRPATTDWVVDQLLDLREVKLPALLRIQAEELASSPAKLIGFTCMFDQTVASLALAHLVKERSPEKLIALGGYAVRPPTAESLINSFPWIDAVCAGEGEGTIVALARAAHGETDLASVTGIIYRGHSGTATATLPPPMVDLTSSPAPDFDDYYLDVADLAANDQMDIKITRLPVENSRGCWWGAVRHCVFCGIHDDDHAYRVKPAAQAINVMDELASRYGVLAFRFSDYILPKAYFRTLLPELVRRGAPYELSAEMKANVHAADFSLLAAAGFKAVQPGIESFSTQVLHNIDKGTSALQNVQALMLGKSEGIRVLWNLLYGFPDDDADDYENMIELLSRIVHLDPPSSRGPVQITRYAPLQADPARFGIRPAVHEPVYDLIFSDQFLNEHDFDMDDFCYYFARPFQEGTALTRTYRRIDALVDNWTFAQRQREVELTWQVVNDEFQVTDTRSNPSGTSTRLDQSTAELLLALDTPKTCKRLLRDDYGFEPAHLDALLADLDRRRFVVRDGNRWLSIVNRSKS